MYVMFSFLSYIVVLDLVLFVLGSQSSHSLMDILGSGSNSTTSTTVTQPSLSSSHALNPSQSSGVGQKVAMATPSAPATSSAGSDSSVPQVAVPTQIKVELNLIFMMLPDFMSPSWTSLGV